MSDFEKFEDIANRIPGVEFKQLKSHPDDRGFFRELIRSSDPFFHTGGQKDSAFAQWSHSKMAQNTVKAWHFHHKQVDWWYVPFGLVHTVLIDNREESPSFSEKIEFLLGDPDEDPRANASIVRIPQGVLHGCRVLSDTAHLFYITSETYDPQDEGRLPFNYPDVPHSWGDEKELIVAPNDRQIKIPPYERTALAAERISE